MHLGLLYTFIQIFNLCLQISGCGCRFGRKSSGCSSRSSGCTWFGLLLLRGELLLQIGEHFLQLLHFLAKLGIVVGRSGYLLPPKCRSAGETEQ